MAGIIIINKASTWPVGTSMLLLVADRTRIEMLRRAGARDELFGTVELHQLIDLAAADAEVFNSFVSATTRALEGFRKSPPQNWPNEMHESCIACWQDLVNKLWNDPRFSESVES
jgi:hypothetical protein